MGSPFQKRKNLEAAQYIQDHWTPRDGLTFEAGIRTEWNEVVRDLEIAPRFAVAWAPKQLKDTKFSAGWGIYYDAISLATITRQQDQESFSTFYLADGTARLSRNGEPIRHFMGTSTFAEYTVMPEIALAKINPVAPLEGAALFACGLSTGLGAAMNTAKVDAGSTCVVFGAGMVGLGAVIGCRLQGADRIICVDLSEDRLTLATQHGATETILGGPDTVWNIGTFALRPGAANVVPSEAEMTLEFRDTETATLDRLEQAFMAWVAEISRGLVKVEAVPTARIVPAAMSPKLGEALTEAAIENGDRPLSMPSGAGHDAMFLTAQIPSAMMFIPSIGGRSHDITENTADSDIIFCCQVMANATEKLIRTLA